ncbi:HAD family hydrolase [Persicobacter psychrovividus]|uniref:Haloacid dehalogenase n=1 Tax=Persicobacter psychrovividus TaxID=387638 RepID=A0ABM7VL37_9BACT|nr:haloacid dehalogenase [Persicobacter psychrovividus]
MIDPKIKTIAFDADDTLWVNETIFDATQERFFKLLEQYVPEEVLRKHLFQTEIKNLKYFGYGVKGFILSMIETAVELTEGLVRGGDIQQIIDWGREMIEHPVENIEGVEQALKTLSQHYQLMVITKGDLLDQESKLARSGLADYFDKVEIVSDKTAAQYQEILNRHDIKAEEFLMIGNSLKSDVLPVLEIGGQAVHIPFSSTWEHETVAPAEESHHQIVAFASVTEFVKTIG